MKTEVTTLLPHLNLVIAEQAPVAWIYIALIICLTMRVWLSLRLLLLKKERRLQFIMQTFSFSDALSNVAILLGIIGTLIGVTVASTGNAGNVQPAEFMETFSNAFGISVSTTIAGSLTYITCLAFSSIDGYIVGDQQ